jgi:hypothetical protein
MRKLHIILLLLVAPIILHAQSVEKFRGNMPTRISNGGEANYYYLPANNSKESKHGRFSYRLRQTKGFSKLYQDVNGNYNQGLKDGRWTFITKFKDYKQDRTSNYLSGTMSLTAEYENGIPHGNWKFSYSYKTREQNSTTSGRAQWDNYSSPENVFISVKFNHMLLFDSLFMQTDDGRSVEGILSEDGFFTGNWNFEDGAHFIREQYDNGLLYRKEIYNKKDTILIEIRDYSDVEMNRKDRIKQMLFSQPKEVKNLTYTLDTVSVFESTQLIPEILNEWIFYNPYLLFRDLDGDNYQFDGFMGGYSVNVVNQVTAEQTLILAVLENHLADFKQVNMRVENLCRGKSTSAHTRSTIQLMTYYERTAEKYVCMANSLTSLPDFEDAKKACEKDCLNTINLTENLPEFRSRDEALAFFLKDLNEKSQTMHSYEGMLQKEVSFK